METLLSLPTELLGNIANKLPPRDVARLRKVSRKTRGIGDPKKLRRKWLTQVGRVRGALRRGNTDEIQRRIVEANGNIPNTVRYRGAQTVLMWAAQAGNEAIVKMLMNRSTTSINLRDSMGQTALIRAAKRNSPAHTRIVRELLKIGASPTIPDKSGMTAFVHATLSNNYEGVRPNLAVLRMLLEHADIGQKNLALRCTMQFAVAKFLLENGADPESPKLSLPRVFQNESSAYTPLMLACGRGRLKFVRLLLDSGALVNARAPPYGYTALHAAVGLVRGGYIFERVVSPDIVKLLLYYQANPILQVDGETVLQELERKINYQHEWFGQYLNAARKSARLLRRSLGLSPPNVMIMH